MDVKTIPGLKASLVNNCTTKTTKELVVHFVGIVPKTFSTTSLYANITFQLYNNKLKNAVEFESTLTVFPGYYYVPFLRNSNSLNYAGLSLDQVSCPLVGDCWVVGTSNNPASPNQKTEAQGVIFTKIPSPTGVGREIKVLVHGQFIAQLISINPVRLRVAVDGIPDTINTLQCPVDYECFLAGSGVNQLPFFATFNTNENFITGHNIGASLAQYQNGAYSSLSCININICVGVGSFTLLHPTGKLGVNAFTNVILTNNPLFAKYFHVYNNLDILNTVSCSEYGTCVAGGDVMGPQGEPGTSLVMYSTSGGDSWGVVDTMKCFKNNNGQCAYYREPVWLSIDGPLTYSVIASVACVPTVRFNCVLSWPQFQQYASTNNGKTWHTDIMADPADTAPLAPYCGQSGIGGVTCDGSGTCFGIVNSVFGTIGGNQQYVYILEGVGGGVKKTWALAGWTNLPNNVGLNLNGISCPTQSSCAAVGSWNPIAKTNVVEPFAMGAVAALNPIVAQSPSWWSYLIPYSGLILAGVGLMLLVSGVGKLTIGAFTLYRVLMLASMLLSLHNIFIGNSVLVNVASLLFATVGLVFGGAVTTKYLSFLGEGLWNIFKPVLATLPIKQWKSTVVSVVRAILRHTRWFVS